jgi:hypothetical protein
MMGWPLGSNTSGFSLSVLTGQTCSLESILARARSALVVFTDAACGGCDALLPEVAGWQRDDASELTIALVKIPQRGCGLLARSDRWEPSTLG